MVLCSASFRPLDLLDQLLAIHDGSLPEANTVINLKRGLGR